MKKKLLSLLMLFGLSLSAVSGCSNDDTSVVERLNQDGKDVVLKVGNTVYTADQLFKDMLESEAGIETVYEKVLRMIVETNVPINDNMRASWELLMDSFDEEVETYALSNGVSEDEARTQLLTEEGYSSVEEKEDAYFYGLRAKEFQDKYWKERKDYYFERYFEERLPYYVKHVLVYANYTPARGAFATTTDPEDATNLYEVYKMLVDGKKFSYIMNEKSVDNNGATSSANTGRGYYMDLGTSFVTEFLHGVYMFDALQKGKTSNVTGLPSEVSTFYANNNFNIINASDIEALGKTADSYTNNNVTIYEDGKDIVTSGNDSTSTGKTLYTDSSMYSRSIIFNQTFNNPGISLINYDLKGDLPANSAEITVKGEKYNVLTDENGNYVFVVCARNGNDPDSGDLQVHFLTVQVSPFDENAKLFFSTDQEKTIDEMVDAYELTVANDADKETKVEAYREELENYKTYVDLHGGTKQTTRNVVIEELEGYVKNYAQKYMNYDIVKYYTGTGKVEFKDDTIKKLLIDQYVEENINLIEISNLNTIGDSWDSYYDRIALANDPKMLARKVPLECSYAANGDSDSLCAYKYDTGFYIKLTLDVNGGDALADSKWSNFYYQLNGETITLPTPTRDGYNFLGWFTTASSEDGVEVTEINTSRTSTLNKTKLYARWESTSSSN